MERKIENLSTPIMGIKDEIDKLEQTISGISSTGSPEIYMEQLAEMNVKLSETLKQKDIFPIKNLITTNANKILKYTEERNNRMEELLMESIVNLHKTIEEKQNQNKIWEDNMEKSISQILSKPTLNYKKDFEKIANKIMTCSPHKLIDTSTKEIMGKLTKTDENQNATLTYLKEIINQKNQEWFKLNNIEKSIADSTRSTKELEETLINSFKNMEMEFSKLNNGDTGYIIHQL
jgi:hypothetical protein